MRLRVQVVIEADDDGGDERLPVVHQVASIERADLTVDTVP